MKELYTIPSVSVHLTGELIDNSISKLIDEKAKTFHRNNLLTAPHAELVGVLTGYNFIKTNRNCGGYCNGYKKEIALRDYGYEWDEVYCNGIKLTRFANEKVTLFHEIAHALQFELERFDKGDTRLLSHAAKQEWQAESIAYCMYKNCIGEIPHQVFGAYFNNKDLVFLKDWGRGWWQNDMGITKSGID